MQPPSQQIVIVGVGQVVQRDVDPQRSREPVALMEDAARLAADGTGDKLLAALDRVVALHVLGWPYPSVATLLRDRLGATGARPVDTHVGGNSPQSAVHELARRIRAGETGVALVAGAEAIRSRRLARRQDVALDWTREGPQPGPGHETWGDDRPGVSAREQRHGLFLPTAVYPIFETALRARLGRSLEKHQAHLGALYQRMSEVAAGNPHAWFPKARTAEEITTPSEINRVIAWPYTKYLNAVMEVDQGAALIVTSAERAASLGVAEDRMVHLWSSAESIEDPWFFSERPRIDHSPAQHAALGQALAEAGMAAPEIDAFDLYSCFPVAVELAMEALGMADDDPRPVTVTGGLAYAGGPGNAYSLHAIARMVERLRERGGTGLVTALGWYLTKHAVGIYGMGPRPGQPHDYDAVASGLAPEMTDTPEGPGTLLGYTVIHDREGQPAQGIVVGRDAQGRRFMANTPPDPELLQEMERREFVGASGVLARADDRTEFTPA